MATANLTWSSPNPLDNVQSITVKYRIYGAGAWTTAVSGLAAATTNYSITGLADNTLYEFSVTALCFSGGPTDSTPIETVAWTCPVLTVTATDGSSISFSLNTSTAGSIDQYTVRLFASNGTTLLQSKTYTPPFANPITDTFVGLSSNTSYKLRVDLRVTGTSQYNYTSCAQITGTTTAATCPAPTGLSATMVSD